MDRGALVQTTEAGRKKFLNVQRFRLILKKNRVARNGRGGKIKRPRNRGLGKNPDNVSRGKETTRERVIHGERQKKMGEKSYVCSIRDDKGGKREHQKIPIS